MKKLLCSGIFIPAICCQMLFGQPTTSTAIIKHVATSKHHHAVSLSITGLPAHTIAPTPSVITGNVLSPLRKMGFGKTWANNLNIKAVRDFVRTFKNVENNEWSITEEGTFTSTFVSDQVYTTVSYDARGNRQWIIRTYDEKKLPRKMLDMVKREYYDATITLVKEYETDHGVITYVHMQDKYTWKIVRIMDGEIELEQNLDKR